MSYLPPEEAGFFEAIQVYFTEACDRMALFGARDRALLEKWKEEGRSARLVCRGIREAVASYGKEDPPRSIAQCEAYVDAEWEKIKERRVGSHDNGDEASPSSHTNTSNTSKSKQEPEPSSPQTGGLLAEARQAIEEAGRKTDEERWRKAYRRAWRTMERLRDERQEFSFAELEDVDAALVEAYLEMLDEEERQLVEDSLASVSAGLLRGMSSKAKKAHLQIKRKRAVVEEFELLDLIEALGG